MADQVQRVVLLWEGYELLLNEERSTEYNLEEKKKVGRLDNTLQH
jgi:hypothetical protein